MIKISQDKIMFLHKLLAEEIGGAMGVRDESLLASAIEGIYQTFDGKELYPTKEEKGARLGYSMISNQAFFDGNKRIGMFAMLTFLEVNGIKLSFSDDDGTTVGLSVAAGIMSYEQLLQWILKHKVN